MFPCDNFKTPAPSKKRDQHSEHAANKRNIGHAPRHQHGFVLGVDELRIDRFGYCLREHNQSLAQLACNPESACQCGAAESADQKDHNLLACDGQRSRHVG